MIATLIDTMIRYPQTRLTQCRLQLTALDLCGVVLDVALLLSWCDVFERRLEHTVLLRKGQRQTAPFALGAAVQFEVLKRKWERVPVNPQQRCVLLRNTTTSNDYLVYHHYYYYHWLP